MVGINKKIIIYIYIVLIYIYIYIYGAAPFPSDTRVNQKPDGVQKTRREHGGNMAAHDEHMQRHEGI